MFLRAAFGMIVALVFSSNSFGQCFENIGYKICVWGGNQIVPCDETFLPNCPGDYVERNLDDALNALGTTGAHEGYLDDFYYQVFCSHTASCIPVMRGGVEGCGPQISTTHETDPFDAGWVNYDLPCL